MNAESTAEQVKALTASVLDLDASRRVGWATYYEAKERGDRLEAELTSTRYQRDLFRRVASYMSGYLQVMSDRLGSAEVPATLSRYMRGMGEYHDGGARREGMDHCRKALDSWTGATEEQIRREALKADQRRRRRAEQREYREVIESLAKQYHFSSVTELRAYLRAHRGERT